MGHILGLHVNPGSLSTGLHFSDILRCRNLDSNWAFLLQTKIVNCKGRFYCLFSNNNREEQARKALESALGGKKNEFEMWNKEIKQREESGGGKDGSGGRGGWFGGGGWFGWSNGDHFWSETQQAGLTVLAIVIMYMIVAKGETLAALVFNPLLYGLRGTREGFTSLTSKLMGRKASESDNGDSDKTWKKEEYGYVSAKESVVRKWGSD
ncbi:PREDICTED: uncharacterized protein LOC104799643 [Tarenaya hassleriana]|uniref:uncharacterized protein LOC104799643 n=1 Tax=Tarenaya hassleriana TaxID=28532 RepID=UPI00053CA552|nr:PREDICTED: uncharacterized protein LOC104799643 [Tarenaya hassleriana]